MKPPNMMAIDEFATAVCADIAGQWVELIDVILFSNTINFRASKGSITGIERTPLSRSAVKELTEPPTTYTTLLAPADTVATPP